MRTSIRLAALSVGVCAALFGAGPASGQPLPRPEPSVQPAPQVPLPPEFDAGFYSPPADVVAATAPGGIIAVREIHVADFSLFPLNVDAWLVSYRSNNHLGQAIPAVATMIKPRGARPEPRKLLSVQIAEDSLSQYCAPSYALQHLSIAPFAGQIVAGAEFLFAQAALQQGWAVVIPDHQGPNSAYAAGPLAGRITLDGIRAATSFGPLGVGTRAPVGMYGYSGGSLATGWAAELKRSYAPELRIVGAATGGNGPDLGAALTMANNQATAGLVMAAVLGLAREYPDFSRFLDGHLDPLGKALAVVKSPLCVQYQSAVLPFMNMKAMLRTQGDPMLHPEVVKLVDETRLGRSVPDMPMFLWHSQWDEILPLGSANQLVDAYCRDPRASVRYTRDWASEHVVAEVTGGPAALLWLRDRLDGVAAQQGCVTADVASQAALPGVLPYAMSTLGESVLALFGKPMGA
ncbi:MAG: triacylglycerol lipase [Mycobacteriaceae bacterium]|nr:triacylglycerol lipase [Mycobacteriaceae bacterium]